MDGKLDLSVPEAGPKSRKPGGGGMNSLLLILVFLLAVAGVYIQLRDAPTGTISVPAGGEAEKTLALRLEEKGLHNAAIDAWERYLAGVSLGSEERAKIYWRLGGLYRKAERFEEAVGAYYRCEAAHRLPDIENELGRRVKECLERLGRFSAVGRELTERTEGVSPEADRVIAEIGQQKITLADLEAAIEQQTDTALQASPYAAGEARKAIREKMLKQMSTAEAKKQMLQRMVIEEVLYRKAMENGLAGDADLKRLVSRLQRQLLAGKVLEQEMEKQIKIGPSDLQNYYEAHKAEFVEKDEEKKTERQLPFDEVKERVAQALYLQKRQEVQARLFAGLKEKYVVVMHPSRLSMEKKAETD